MSTKRLEIHAEVDTKEGLIYLSTDLPGTLSNKAQQRSDDQEDPEFMSQNIRVGFITNTSHGSISFVSELGQTMYIVNFEELKGLLDGIPEIVENVLKDSPLAEKVEAANLN